MKEHIERDEMSVLFKSAFDRSVPDDTVKEKIFNDILDECESAEKSKTSMETVFLIRRVCITCAAILVVIVLSGGAFKSLSSLIGQNINRVSS